MMEARKVKQSGRKQWNGGIRTTWQQDQLAVWLVRPRYLQKRHK